MSDFETAVAQQVAQTWLLERALHSEGDWSFRTSFEEVYATRIIDEETRSVLFVAVLDVAPWTSGETVLELLCDEEMVSARVVDLPPGRSVVEWELSLAQTTTV